MWLAESHLGSSPETVLFTDLVRAGEEHSHVTLRMDLRIFLVSCLIEHMRDPEIVWRVLALDFLTSTQRGGQEQAVFLKRSGDASLILAGLFPERALRLRVSSDYFRQMGQSFFGSLAAHFAVHGADEQGHFYGEVARAFETLERVLIAARKTDDEWGAFRRFLVKLH